MWARPGVVLLPVGELLADILQIREHLDIQAFIPQPTIEAFDQPIINGLARSDELELNVMPVGPSLHGPTRELTAVVHRDRSGHPAVMDNRLQGRGHLCASQRPLGQEEQTFPGELITTGQIRNPRPSATRLLMKSPRHR